ncbi:MAG: hypothetical protein ACOH1T_01610 [Microbacteriaceae bacterium]
MNRRPHDGARRSSWASIDGGVVASVAVVAAVAVVSVASLTGCTSTADANDNPRAVEQQFFDALSNSDARAALALTTTKTSALDCSALISDYGTLTAGVAGVSVGEATVDGDTASVAFSYTVVQASENLSTIAGTHSLIRSGGRWRIELPDTYRIRATIAPDVAAEVSVDSSPQTAGACVDVLSSGTFDAIALPGLYTLGVRDPSGVFGDAAYTAPLVTVSDAPESGRAIAVDYPSEDSRRQVAIGIRNALVTPVERCAASGFVAPTCPDDLPAPSDSITLASRPADRFTGVPTATRIFSADGTIWRFEASGEQYLYTANGVAKSYPMMYTGAVIVSPSAPGALTVVLD